MTTISVWMIPQEDYSPVWEYLMQRAGFNDQGGDTNAYFLYPARLTTEDGWHLEDTKWRRVEADMVDFTPMWDYDFDGNGFIDGFQYNDNGTVLFESASLDAYDISTLYWFNTADHIPYQAERARFLIVRKSDTKEASNAPQ